MSSASSPYKVSNFVSKIRRFGLPQAQSGLSSLPWDVAALFIAEAARGALMDVRGYRNGLRCVTLHGLADLFFLQDSDRAKTFPGSVRLSAVTAQASDRLRCG